MRATPRPPPSALRPAPSALAAPAPSTPSTSRPAPPRPHCPPRPRCPPQVVVEVDMPGHAFAWGLGYPEITLADACPPSLRADLGAVNVIPLHPTR